MRYLSLVLLLGLIVGCGKVTQNVTPKEPIEAFSVSYSVETISTGNVALLETSSPLFNPVSALTTVETRVYSAIFSVSASGKRELVSWGEGRLVANPLYDPVAAKATANYTVKPLIGQSVDSAGVVLTQAQKGSVFVTNSEANWAFSATKLRVDVPAYLMVVYTDANRAWMQLLESETYVTTPVVALSKISLYDTFISQLVLAMLSDFSDVLIKDHQWTRLKALYNQAFFESVRFEFLPNTVTKFDPKDPEFVYSESDSTVLTTLFKLAIEDKASALSYLKDVPETQLTKRQKTILESNIETSFSIQARESIDSTLPSGPVRPISVIGNSSSHSGAPGAGSSAPALPNGSQSFMPGL